MNIIKHRKNGWYFVDELWGEEIGPYKSKRKTKKELKKYINALNKKEKIK